MIRITVDTNLLVAATLTSGLAEKIIDLAEQKKIIIFSSESILKEFFKVLHYEEIQERIQHK